jgi:uncharacterized protein YciI
MTTPTCRFENSLLSKLKAHRTRLIVSVVILCSIAAIAPARSYPATAQEPKFEMGTFYICLLIKPSSFDPSKAPPQLLQKHFKHVQELIASGKAAIAGPFGDDTRIAGIFILNASSPEEARSIEEADPLVKEGGFSVEVLKWWAAKGIMKPPAQPFKQVTYYFTFLRRGPNWTAQRTPETEKLQAAHMANINAMAKTGKLVIAGPFENAGEFAGVFVFKVATLDEAKALAESDPAVKAGRLKVDTHPWLVAEGSLP